MEMWEQNIHLLLLLLYIYVYMNRRKYIMNVYLDSIYTEVYIIIACIYATGILT
jgi:hypothetical protein